MAPQLNENPPEGDSPLNLLDDGVLLAVMSHLDPMPDIFLLARTCLRLKRLAHDKKNNLVVGSAGPVFGHNHYRTLASAVAASRPGDTILLAPGTHAVHTTITTRHVLHIMGGGEGPEATVICGPGHCAATLDVRHTCKVTNVTIASSGLGPGVIHQSGVLALERCHVVCTVPPGLAHLPGCAPLVTTAGGSRGVGPGRLSVVECSVEGGEKAVHCLGSGVLHAVRAVYQARKTWLYFDIDCRPAPTQTSGPAAAVVRRAAGAVAAARTVEGIPGTRGTHSLLACASGDSSSLPELPLAAPAAGCTLLLPTPAGGALDVGGPLPAAPPPAAATQPALDIALPAQAVGSKRAAPAAEAAPAGIAKLARLLQAEAVPVAVFSAELVARRHCSQPPLSACLVEGACGPQGAAAVVGAGGLELSPGQGHRQGRMSGGIWGMHGQGVHVGSQEGFASQGLEGGHDLIALELRGLSP